MALREILDKFLTMPISKRTLIPVVLAVALVAAGASSCESDADDLAVMPGQKVNVMTSIFTPSAPIEVHLTGSVPYSSADSYSTVGDATVYLFVNSRQNAVASIADGQTSAEFARQALADYDTVTIKALTGNNEELSASAIVMPQTVIEATDTSTSVDKLSLRFAITMTDSAETSDFYMIEAHRISYAAGKAQDTVLSCNYTSNAFYDLPNGITTANVIGLFSDERLRRNNRGQSTLRLSIPWQRLRTPSQSWGADSVEVAIRLYHLAEDYYTFLATSSNSDNYFLLPVFGSSAVTTNVKGGYGIVACAVYDEKKFRVIKKNEAR